MLHLSRKPCFPVVVWIFWNYLNAVGRFEISWYVSYLKSWEILFAFSIIGILCTIFCPTVFSNFLLCCVSYSRPPWFDLPPPPYCSEFESPNQPDLPPYRSRSGSLASTDTPMAESPVGTSDSWTRDVHGSMDGHRTLLERTVDQSDSLVSHIAEREVWLLQ